MLTQDFELIKDSEHFGNFEHLDRPRALVAVALLAALASCSSKNSLPVTCASSAFCTAGSSADAGLSASSADSSPAALATFTPPRDPGPGGILFSASGEVLALTGYPFPPANADDPAFVDGWDVHFTRLLVTLDNVTLAEGANASPGDESCTESTVAKVSGPWAVDLSHPDPSYLPGKGGPGEQAVPITALARQNVPAGNTAPFDTSGTTPYAFGFDIVAATASAINVNLDAAGLVDYQAMIGDGCSVLYVGTATFKGASCTCPTATNPSQPCTAETYAGWPTVGQVVPFHLCFRSPTSYVNCQNPDNDPAKALAGEEHQRGIFFKQSASVIAQMTVHTDHPFWDSVLHDSPAHFDQFAALVAGQATNGTFPPVTTDLARSVDYTAYTDAQGHALTWRYCLAPPTDVHPQLTGPMAFDGQSVAHTSSGNGCAGLGSYYDFATYNQSTQGHLNSDGLCYVARHYPSPQ